MEWVSLILGIGAVIGAMKWVQGWVGVAPSSSNVKEYEEWVARTRIETRLIEVLFFSLVIGLPLMAWLSQ